MLQQIEGSQGVARAVALCRPEVICAYPISPQTHIVEALGALVRKGTLQDCEYINVESEFAAMSVAIGASAAGARAYTATASQGLLFMAEAIYNASGLGLPIVMTVANRAIGSPINIWNDHSDSLSQRDSGWLQLFAENNQEAADLHIIAYKLAEALSLPIMVCMDGFVLTHAVERVDIPTQEDVDAFLPPFSPRQVLDPAAPVSIGAMVGPEAFTEVKYLLEKRMDDALTLIPQVAQEFYERFHRHSGGLVETYRCEDAQTRVIAMGAALGTIKDAVDEMRDAGVSIGVVNLKSFRPFPTQALCAALEGAKNVVVIDRAFSLGCGGVVDLEVRAHCRGMGFNQKSVIAGLGGRAITKKSLQRVFAAAINGTLEDFHFMDLDRDLVEKQRELERTTWCTGPVPETMMAAAARKAAKTQSN